MERIPTQHNSARGYGDDFAKRLNAEGVTGRAEKVDMLEDGSSVFKVAIKGPGGQMTTNYTMGSAHKNGPDLIEVLDSILMESVGWFEARDFSDWIRDYGYSGSGEEGREAKRIYNLCGKQHKNINRVLGEKLYRELAYMDRGV